MPALYPELDARECGRLDVGDGHTLFWESCGRSGGKPALVLHGGPGSGCNAWHRRLFDPDRYHIVLFDQRSCGRSTPHASLPDVDLSANTTHHLVADIERLRTCLGIERWLVLGGSWGSTLALAYAEAWPDRVSELVLFAVTAGLRSEFDRVFRGGLAEHFPAQWQRLRRAVGVAPGRDGDVVRAVHHRLFHPDPAVRADAAHEWCLWESAIPEWPPARELLPRFRDPDHALAFARIVTHYVLHDAWLEDGSLLANAERLADTPVRLIDGRHDPQTTRTAEALLRRLPLARHVVVEDASHAASQPSFSSALVRATDELAASGGAARPGAGAEPAEADGPANDDSAYPASRRAKRGRAPGLELPRGVGLASSPVTIVGSYISPYVRKVLVCLHLKGVEYRIDPIVPFFGDDEFTRISPVRRVPVLIDGALVLPDSTPICEYLEDRHPDPPLLPRQPAQRARARWLEEFADTRMGEVFIWQLFNQLVINRFVWGVETDPEIVRDAREQQIPRILDYLEGEVPTQGHLFGAISLADIALATFFRNAAFARYTVDAERWPATASYVARVLDHPGFVALRPFEELSLRTPIAEHRTALRAAGAPVSEHTFGSPIARRGILAT